MKYWAGWGLVIAAKESTSRNSRKNKKLLSKYVQTDLWIGFALCKKTFLSCFLILNLQMISAPVLLDEHLIQFSQKNRRQHTSKEKVFKCVICQYVDYSVLVALRSLPFSMTKRYIVALAASMLVSTFK